MCALHCLCACTCMGTKWEQTKTMLHTITAGYVWRKGKVMAFIESLLSSFYESFLEEFTKQNEVIQWKHWKAFLADKGSTKYTNHKFSVFTAFRVQMFQEIRFVNVFSGSGLQLLDFNSCMQPSAPSRWGWWQGLVEGQSLAGTCCAFIQSFPAIASIWVETLLSTGSFPRIYHLYPQIWVRPHWTGN